MTDRMSAEDFAMRCAIVARLTGASMEEVGRAMQQAASAGLIMAETLKSIAPLRPLWMRVAIWILHFLFGRRPC